MEAIKYSSSAVVRKASPTAYCGHMKQAIHRRINFT